MIKRYCYLESLSNTVMMISDKRLPLFDVYEVIVDDTVEITSQEFLLAALRAKRNMLIADTMWIHERHSSQEVKTISEAKYQEFQNYWQTLRDLPATANLTNITLATLNSVFPTPPTL